MISARARVICGVFLVTFLNAGVIGQTQPSATTPPSGSQQSSPASKQDPGTGGGTGGGTDQKTSPTDQSSALTNLQKQLDDINKYLADQKGSESDFSLVLGIGSLILAPGVTDYINQSNVLATASLGKATPQFLTGVSFRTRLPSLFTRFGCGEHTDKKTKETREQQVKAAGGDPTKLPLCYGDVWQRNPWNAFLSLKFAPGASNPINGYVLGGSFSIAHYLDILVGFGLTPVSEPSPGFRAVAAQFVTAQQKLGLDLNFNPTAMLNNNQNAFDGFPTTNPATGALLYPGNPLATHYRGSVVIGASVPIAFSSFLKGGGNPPSTSAPAASSSPK